jgi:ketosteroid isomerase-like protein
MLEPIKSMKAAIQDPRYEMIAPKVQQHGDVALLTFNLINYGKAPGRPEAVLSRWNSTEVYSRIAGKWKIIHSHWSYTKPELK